MMCGAVTVYSPLVEYGAGTKAKDVGILGIGGLGHFGVLFAKAMGANVTAISSSHRKDEDAKKLGASKVLVMGDDAKAAFKESKRSLDLIICASSESEIPFQGSPAPATRVGVDEVLDAPNLPLNDLLTLLRPHGTFVYVGVPEEESMPKIHPFNVIMCESVSPDKPIYATLHRIFIQCFYRDERDANNQPTSTSPAQPSARRRVSPKCSNSPGTTTSEAGSSDGQWIKPTKPSSAWRRERRGTDMSWSTRRMAESSVRNALPCAAQCGAGRRPSV